MSNNTGSNTSGSATCRTEIHPLAVTTTTTTTTDGVAANHREHTTISSSSSSSNNNAPPERELPHPQLSLATPARPPPPPPPSSTTTISTTTSTLPSTTVASLIQSAARVSLYNNNNDPNNRNSYTNSGNRNRNNDTSSSFPTSTTPTATTTTTEMPPLFPHNNEYDDFVHSLFISQQREQPRHHPTGTTGSSSNNNNDNNNNDNNNLSSLRQAILPTLPDEQDRKRFIGCIAAIIVAMYQYDDDDKKYAAKSNSNNNNNNNNNNNSNATAAMTPNESDNSWSQSLYDEDINLYHSEIDELNHDDDDEEDEDFDYFDNVMDDHLNQNNNTSNNNNNNNNKNSNMSSAQKQRRPLAASLSSSSSSSIRRQGSQTTVATTTAGSTSTSSGLFTNRNHLATILAQKRYRKRRYELYGQFLITSTEHLLLDKGHGRCFLPILEQLLVVRPTQPSIYAQKTSTTHSSQQQQRRYHPKSNTFYDIDYVQYQMNEMSNLRPFLEGLTPGAGIRCISMLLLQHLLHSNTTNGYDARIRHVLKSIGVLVILHDIMMEKIQDQHLAQERRRQSLNFLSSSYSCTDVLFVDETNDDYDQSYNTNSSSSSVNHNIGGSGRRGTTGSATTKTNHSPQEIFPADLLTVATLQYQSLEQYLARTLMEISVAQQQQQQTKKKTSTTTGSLSSRDIGTSTRDKIFRGLKIGGTAVAAGTLFAITGGLAAPGIAAGIAAVVGTTGFATAAITLTTHAAVMSIFGVGGGTMVAYKMKRRTVGLTEFEFCKETPATTNPPSSDHTPSSKNVTVDIPDAELFYTVCISGWLRDDCDFQRPWGLSPTRPPIEDRLELLERFYSVYRPGHVPRCAKILESWKNEEQQLWKLLRQTYHRDPDHLFPLQDGPRFRGSLTLEQREAVEKILEELGCVTPNSAKKVMENHGESSPLDRMQFNYKDDATRSNSLNTSIFRDDSSHGFDDIAPVGDETEVANVPHLATVWDYHATYGGELYTVRWESDLIEELCMSVFDLAADVVTGATSHLLKFTVLSALAAALAIPVALKNAANMIDGTWTLVVERSDLAGKELAQSLLFSTAGNRPVNLIGFSFGARVIYACLKELARYQEKWEDYQEQLAARKASRNRRENTISADENNDYMRKMREPASIVGDVILMGLPNHMSHASWQACRRIVAGRLVNCYSRKDLILSLMFQYKKFGFKPVCGTCPVDVAGVENFDVSDLVSGHQDYCLITGDILKRVRLDQPFRHDFVDQLDYLETNEVPLE